MEVPLLLRRERITVLVCDSVTEGNSSDKYCVLLLWRKTGRNELSCVASFRRRFPTNVHLLSISFPFLSR
jgi:hypothetical protein